MPQKGKFVSKESGNKDVKAEAQGGELPAGAWGMPPDGLCLSHACVAIVNPRRFRRTPRDEQGTALRAGHVRRDQRRAQQFLQRVIRRMESLGFYTEASRLQLSGVAGSFLFLDCK